MFCVHSFTLRSADGWHKGVSSSSLHQLSSGSLPESVSVWPSRTEVHIFSYLSYLMVTSTHFNSRHAGSRNRCNPANTQRNKHVVNTSKHRFDVIIMCLLRCVFAANGIDRATFFRFSHTSCHHRLIFMKPYLSFVQHWFRLESIFIFALRCPKCCKHVLS